MKRKFGVEVNLNVPKVPYKETLKGKTNVQGSTRSSREAADNSVTAGSTSSPSPGRRL